jgi:hypothetical protein
MAHPQLISGPIPFQLSSLLLFACHSERSEEPLYFLLLLLLLFAFCFRSCVCVPREPLSSGKSTHFYISEPSSAKHPPSSHVEHPTIAATRPPRRHGIEQFQNMDADRITILQIHRKQHGIKHLLPPLKLLR